MHALPCALCQWKCGWTVPFSVYIRQTSTQVLQAATLSYL